MAVAVAVAVEAVEVETAMKAEARIHIFEILKNWKGNFNG